MRRALAAGTIAVALAGSARAQPTADRTDPVVHLFAPAYASDTSRDRHFRIRWQGVDSGSGIAGYRLQVRPNADIATRWRIVRTAPNARTATFRGRPGHAYVFRVRSRDLDGNLSTYAYASTVVPLDDRSRRIRRSPRWLRVRDRDAYGGGVSRTVAAGSSMRLRFRGDRVALIASRSRRGGRLRVAIGKSPHLVSLRGKRAHRQVVFRSKVLRPGLHLLHLRSLSRGVAEVDGVGVDTGPPPPRR
jgi:hypothetical protein